MSKLRNLFFGLFLVGGFAAQAATPVQTYLSQRDRVIKALDREYDESLYKEDQQAMAELEKRLTGLIGPVDLQGFPGKGKINLQTLMREMGFGMLDGLSYTASDKTKAVVTTKPLLQAWIKEHETWWNEKSMPQEMESALKSDAFYTQAIAGDVSIARYAELPVSAPVEGGFVYAMLSAGRQEYNSQLPNEINVAVVRGDRVFILTQRVEAKIQRIAACDQIWAGYMRKQEEALKAFRATNDEKYTSESTRLEQEGDQQFRNCFAQKFKDQAAYQAVIRQAQNLVQRLPSP
ncbi:hypothetical protein [Microvirga solisilvae]|uniref:hypothetical protein n=1 Tax=Microvirga solisilvae TaxID=2919498 RepID=UPI001FB0054C|nr:hypothetical protein [Microvirga solisilvae]